jgi:predicted CXXCH cytochrome family protein
MLLASWVAGRPAMGQDPPAAVSYCLDCHADSSLSLAFDDGSEMSLEVKLSDLEGSVHAKQLVCTDCHEGYDNGDNHPAGRTFANRRAYVTGIYEMCRKCHFDTYTRTLESVHFDLLKKGSEKVPVCSDCHGAHDIHDPHAKRAMISRSCAKCHQDINATYEKSVHGRALSGDDNQDVPGCADCHTAHAIADPRNPSFRQASPTACVRCHGDAARMDKYGIPTDVATTYLTDFHGVTASLSKGPITDRQVVVTCVDCHGVHDIGSTKAQAAEGMKARVEVACAKCHQGAAKDFPAAWLSHYRPSLQHAPLVYLVELGYKVFIPFMVVGLVLQVLLHLYRVAIRR